MASHSALPPASEVWMKSRYVVSLSKRGRYGMGSYDVAALAAAAARCILARAWLWGAGESRAHECPQQGSHLVRQPQQSQHLQRWLAIS